MKHITIIIIATWGFLSQVYAQSPQMIQYQAIARDNSGLPVSTQMISVRFSIIQNTPTGTISYVETHNPTTNSFGLFTLKIGSGTVNNGSFSAITWGQASHYLKVELDPTGGSSYTDMGTSELISVPYALYANEVANKDDADADPTNEIQTMTLSGDTLALSGSNNVVLNTGSQQLSKSDSILSLTNGGQVILNDDDPNNELQSLSLVGSQLTISGANTINLPSGGISSLDMAYDYTGTGAGRTISVDAGEIDLSIPTVSGIGIRTTNTNTGVGLVASSTVASNPFAAIQATTNTTNTAAAAIIGNSSSVGYGVVGQVLNTATAEAALYGSSFRTNGGHGVLGIGFNGTVGQTNYSSGYGIYGENFDAVAPLGNGVGVAGKGYYGVLGEDRYLGGVAGAYGVYSNGSLGATGTKTFRIDHPLDPENKFLRHFSIESDEVLNVYRGTAVFDSNGEAIVSLPDYYKEINRSESYQLTPIGAYMPLYIKQKVDNNGRFIVAGGVANKEVSWVIYAERNDRYMQQNPNERTVELEKRAQEKGKYLIPSLYQQPVSKGIFYSKMPNTLKQTSIRLID